MKKLFNKILTPIIAISIATPISCIAVSCAHSELKSFKLSAYPQYISKGEKLQIFVDPQPVDARANDLNWEISVPEGIETSGKFSISQGGLISAPADFTCPEPKSLTVTATYIPNPEIKASLDVMVIENANDDFLGFLGNKLEFLNRFGDGPAFATINKTNKTWTDPSSGHEYTTVYEVGYDDDESINLFTHRIDDYINFTPIFKPGVNTRMSYHIYHSIINEQGQEEEVSTHCIDWQPGYKDRIWTDIIPQPFALGAEFRTDEIHVVPYIDQNVILKIKLNIYQSTIYTTSGIFNYVPDGEGASSQYQIKFEDIGVYNSYLLCPSEKPAVDPEYHMGDIYCFRSPKEYLSYDKIEFKPAKDIDPEIFDITLSEPIKTHLLSDPNYPAYKFDLDYKVNWDKIPAGQWGGEQKWIGTISVYDTEIDPLPAAKLELFIQWIKE